MVQLHNNVRRCCIRVSARQKLFKNQITLAQMASCWSKERILLMSDTLAISVFEKDDEAGEQYEIIKDF